ncbi:hypothetical protein DENSPDRAFT_880608 [Dentipellis sp. KUC8613]|nr:hypothetical protein DENSPDRAFT_880608 [Dentipellis sp. KUC8613]
MFVTKPSKLALTLLFYTALALALVAHADAKGFASVPLHHRGHADLTRMIKKRLPADTTPNAAANLVDPAAQGAAPNPPSDSTDSNTNGSNAAAGSGSNNNSPAQQQSGSASQSANSASASSPASQSQSSSSSSSAAPTSSSQSSSSSSQSSSASNTLSSLLNSLTNTASSTPPTSAAPTSTPAPQQSSAAPNFKDAPDLASSTPAQSVDAITITSSVPGASQTSQSDKQNTPQGSSKLSHTTLTIIIVLASCIGGTAIIWTVIRKWKFRPSSQFEDRMQPIDWQPTDHDSGLPTHRRVPSNASSFHSSGHDGASTRGYGATASENPLNPIPDHDFTAGAMTLAPGAGYADLARGPSPGPYARGPSPGPQMQESLSRGPSLTRTHDEYGVPLHYQGGYHAGY